MLKGKTYYIVGVDKINESERYIWNGNNYYVYDAIDGSIEFWSGTDLVEVRRDTRMFAAKLYLNIGDFIRKQNELILARNSKYIYTWYHGLATVWDASNDIGNVVISSLNPMVVGFGKCIQVDGLRISYDDMIRRITLEAL